MTVSHKAPAEQERFLQKLIELPDEARRKQFLTRYRKQLRPEVVTRLTEAVHAKVRVDSEQAVAIAETALAVARRIRDKPSIARSLRAMANALHTLGKNREAMQFHEQALQTFEIVGDDLEVGITLSSSLQPLILLGEYDRSLKAAERARNIFTAKDEKRRLARLDINVGNILHRQDRFEEALACYERAYEWLSSGQDKEAIAAVLSNLAVCLIAMNDFPRALKIYEQAREFCQQNEMPVLADQADYNIAYLYYLRGEYGRAIQMLHATRDACRITGDVYQLALCYLDLSEIYVELNLSGEAVEAAHEGHRLFQENGTGYEGAKCLANEATALAQQGKAFRAIELFTQARRKFEEENNSVWPSLIDLYQALVLFEQGRLFEARRLCHKAQTFFATSTVKSKAVLCDLLLARISLRDGDERAAARDCRAALGLLQTVEAPALMCQAQSLMGQIQRAAGDNEAAYISFQLAREALESLRNGLRGEELKIAFLKDKLEVYEGLVEVCLERGNATGAMEEAFSYIEDAKSRILTDLLVQRGPMLADAGAGKSEMVRRIRHLREELNWYYHRIDIEQLRPEEKTPERLANLRREAKSREEDFLRVLREIEDTDGHALGVSKVPFSTIRASLPVGTVLVEYFTIGDRIIACILGRDTLEIKGVTLVSRVVEFLRLLHFQISRCSLAEKDVAHLKTPSLTAVQSHLRKLYDELIAPLREQLCGQHLVIAPHGPLHYVPFHALYDGTSYLIDSFTISYAPNASLFTLCQAEPATTNGASLVMGLPDENAPAIRDEVQRVAQVLPSAELFLGADATLETLKNRGPHSRFIHIATHGEFRHDNPMFSGIRLGDTRLNLYDLYQLQLPADLVTLSGCATGMNAVAAGDELLGLTRGLFCAGARTLLLTLWNIHDLTTTEFMVAFYKHMNQGEEKPRALQQAMFETRARCPHPYYWAPFFLVGKAF